MSKSLSTETIFKGVIGYVRAHPNGTPKAAEGAAWDGAAEVAAASVEDLMAMCAWYDSGAPDVKSSYKLPHHKQGGGHSVVWNGVRAAMGALNGARSSMNIPAADRRGIYGHLARHYREFDKEVPVLKYAPSGEDAITQEPVFFSVVFVSAPVAEPVDTAKLAVDGLQISGFMSMKREDRQGDVIDPKLFDLDTYMKNPQLWVNHALWKDQNGNGISVGVTESANRARVKLGSDGVTADILDFDTGNKITTVETKDFVVSDGDAGVWVVCRVMLPDVIELIRTKRLNAFSWHGVLLRRANGVPFRMDLYEISLVNVPANQRAVFQIGKSVIVTYADGTRFQMNSEAKGEAGETSTVTEHDLLCAFHALSGGDAKTEAFDNEQEGGDGMLTEDQTKELLASVAGLAERLKILDTVVGQLASVDARLETLEEAKTKAADEAAAAAEKVTAEAAATEEASDKVEEKPAEENVVKTQLTAITQALGVLPTLVEDVKKFGTRLDTLEKSPAVSKGITDGDGAHDENSADETATRSAFLKLPAADRTRIGKVALSRIVVPMSVLRHP